MRRLQRRMGCRVRSIQYWLRVLAWAGGENCRQPCYNWLAMKNVIIVIVLLTSFAPNARAQLSLNRRVPWTTSRITGSPEPPKRYVTEPVFRNLVFDQP